MKSMISPTVLIAMAILLISPGTDSKALTAEQQTKLVNLINKYRQGLGGSDLETVCWSKAVEQGVSLYGCNNAFSKVSQGRLLHVPAPGTDSVQGFWDKVLSYKDTADSTMKSCNLGQPCSNLKYFTLNKFKEIACVTALCGVPGKWMFTCLIVPKYEFQNGDAAYTKGTECTKCAAGAGTKCVNKLCENTNCKAPAIPGLPVKDSSEGTARKDGNISEGKSAGSCLTAGTALILALPFLLKLIKE